MRSSGLKQAVSLNEFTQAANFLNSDGKVRYRFNKASKHAKTNTITQRTDKAFETIRVRNSKLMKREYSVSNDSKIFDKSEPFPESSPQRLREHSSKNSINLSSAHYNILD